MLQPPPKLGVGSFQLSLPTRRSWRKGKESSKRMILPSLTLTHSMITARRLRHLHQVMGKSVPKPSACESHVSSVVYSVFPALYPSWSADVSVSLTLGAPVSTLHAPHWSRCRVTPKARISTGRITTCILCWRHWRRARWWR